MSSDRIGRGPLSDSARNYAIAIHLLYLAGIFNGVTTLIGVIIAYVKRNDFSTEADRSHFSAAITTFWVTLVGVIVGTLTTVILIGFVILAIVGIWYLYRIIIGLIRAMD